MKNEPIDIRSKRLNEIVLKTNAMLNAAFRDMRDKKVEEATVTVKISVAIAEIYKEVDGEMHPCQKPVISCDIKKTVNHSERSTALINTGDVELEEDNGKFVLVPTIGSQVSMEEMQDDGADDALLADLAEEYGVDVETARDVVAGKVLGSGDIADPIYYKSSTEERA